MQVEAFQIFRTSVSSQGRSSDICIKVGFRV